MAKFEVLIRAKQERGITETDCFANSVFLTSLSLKEQLEASKSR